MRMNDYAYRGARALVLLHDAHLRAFLATWKRAKEAGVVLAAAEDPAYASMAALLRHVLGAARGYMTWCCEVLELPDPEIGAPPEEDGIAAEADAYLVHLLERWDGPLCSVPPERFEDRAHASRWGTPYCVDAMLEHAVMHPIRHAFQLERLMTACLGS